MVANCSGLISDGSLRASNLMGFEVDKEIFLIQLPAQTSNSEMPSGQCWPGRHSDDQVSSLLT